MLGGAHSGPQQLLALPYEDVDPTCNADRDEGATRMAPLRRVLESASSAAVGALAAFLASSSDESAEAVAGAQWLLDPAASPEARVCLHMQTMQRLRPRAADGLPADARVTGIPIRDSDQIALPWPGGGTPLARLVHVEMRRRVRARASARM